MSQSLAPSRSFSLTQLVCFEVCPGPRSPANDNGDLPDSDLLLHAALRHFAEHGISAARAARAQAEAAFFTGDRAGYDWWLAICRTLDRRLAAQLDFDFDRKTSPAA